MPSRSDLDDTMLIEGTTNFVSKRALSCFYYL